MPPPVYLLAAGPRMIELAGEVADGAFLIVGLHPGAVAEARRHLEAGARRAGRSLDGFQTVFIVPLALEDQGPPAPRWPQHWFAPGHPWLAYPSASNLHWLRQAGIELPEDHDTGASPTSRPRASRTRSACSARPSTAPSGCSARARRPGSSTSSCSPPTPSPAATTCRREVDAFRRVIRTRLGG